MRNRNPERKIKTMTSALDAHFENRIKNLNFSLPAIIQTYTATTKRATVQPALDTLFADGKSRPKPLLANVPVIQPSGGGYTVNFPHAKGDAVMLLVSQRGIAKFKENYKQALPSRISFFSLIDAVAIPGFGGRNITPAVAGGVSLQSEDGRNHISISGGNLTIGVTGNITIDAEGVTINTGRFDVNEKA